MHDMLVQVLPFLQQILHGYLKTNNTTIKNNLTKELEQVRRDKIDKDTKLAIVPKEKVKQVLGRSPDYSDALMLRMYYELKPQGVYFIQ